MSTFRTKITITLFSLLFVSSLCAQDGAERLGKKYFSSKDQSVKAFRTFQNELRTYFKGEKRLIKVALSETSDALYLKSIVADVIPKDLPFTKDLGLCWTFLEESLQNLEGKKSDVAKERFDSWVRCTSFEKGGKELVELVRKKLSF